MRGESGRQSRFRESAAFLTWLRGKRKTSRLWIGNLGRILQEASTSARNFARMFCNGRAIRKYTLGLGTVPMGRFQNRLSLCCHIGRTGRNCIISCLELQRRRTFPSTQRGILRFWRRDWVLYLYRLNFLAGAKDYWFAVYTTQVFPFHGISDWSLLTAKWFCRQ
jgi:hypothetical protein